MFTVSYPVTIQCFPEVGMEDFGTGFERSSTFSTLAECDAFINDRIALGEYTDREDYWIALADEIRIGDLVIAG